jgi:hypothetical protein
MATELRMNGTSEAAIFGRLWDRDRALSPTVAKHVLKLKFSDAETERMHELAAKNRGEGLSKEEAEELDNFIRVGDLLAILQSKARRVLKVKPLTAKSHG